MKLISTIALCLLALTSSSQGAATDFTVTDCSGNARQLYTELDAGKVVVLVWVMPCVGCLSGALAAQAEVQEALAANPGKVTFWIADDYANTLCKTMEVWCGSNGIEPDAIIKDKSVSMNHYGADGMPKIVIAAGKDHKVFYNKNDQYIEQAGIKAAMAEALAAAGEVEVAGIKKHDADIAGVALYPNPVSHSGTLLFSLKRSSVVTARLFSASGALVQQIFKGRMEGGDQKLSVNTSELAPGEYFIAISDGTLVKQLRLLVER